MRIAFIAIGFALTLSACDTTMPTRLESGKITVGDKIITKSYDLYAFDDMDVQTLAREIAQSTERQLTLNISYFMTSDDNKTLAENKGHQLVEKFAAQKITNVDVEIIPVDRVEKAGVIVVSYKTRVAEAPSTCTEMPGANGASDMNNFNDYSIGCGSKMALSKMIANPDDLLGTSGSGNVESRRAGQVVEKYKSGEPNKSLDGYQLSKIGSGGN